MITNLKVTNLRNLSQINLSPKRCNVIIGKNGSGKTSMLESLFLLSRGKSFRTHQPKRYIQHHSQASTVFARFDDNTTLAIQKQTDASTHLKLNGDTVRTQSQMTKYMPTLLIDPTSMDILEQGSASRRQLLDWLAFHVKQGFYPHWLAYQRLLKQRNSLLKQIKFISESNLQQIQAWDMSIASHANQINHYRQQVFNEWLPHFANSIEQLLPQYAENITVSYQAGFDIEVPLHETLAERLQQDLHQGYTRVGCHRADIHVVWRDEGDKQSGQSNIKEQAVNVLSRGEKKLLITALRLSQLPLLQTEGQTHQTNPHIDETIDVERLAIINNEISHEAFLHKNYVINSNQSSVPIVLVDDITAELDENAIHVLLKNLASLDCQLYITSLTEDILPQLQKYWGDCGMFHVERGGVISVSAIDSVVDESINE